MRVFSINSARTSEHSYKKKESTKYESKHSLYFLPKNGFKMDHRPQCKTWNYKTPRRNMGENLDDLAFGNFFSDTTRKVWSMKQINKKLDLKLKTCALQKRVLRECKDKSQTGKIYFQNTYLIKDCTQNIQRASKTQQ